VKQRALPVNPTILGIGGGGGEEQCLLCLATGRCAFTDTFLYFSFCSFFNVIKGINTAVQLLKNNSSHGSFQLGAAGMGKSHCEQSVLFTCNKGTNDSSTSTCINSH
jgi:hypothetical protein